MTQQLPLIVAFIPDMFLSSKLANVSCKLGFRLELIAHADQIAPPDCEPSAPIRPGEPMHGRVASLFQWVVDRQPQLIVFDLDTGVIPWQRWMASLKSSPATRRIPMLAYAPQAAQEAWRYARDCRIESVVSRAEFGSRVAKLIGQLVPVADWVALTEACALPLSDAAVRGLELFNRQAFYECHHALEEAWNEDTSEARNLYKGILQVAVAYFQIERGNYNGGNKLLLRMRQWLEPLPVVCRGVAVGQLLQDALAVQAELQRLGRGRIAEFDRALFKPVLFEIAP